MESICAIATPYGNGAISIIRCSGYDSIELVNKIFKGKDLTKVNGNTIHYGYIIDKDEIIDEVMVSVFKKPHSFDGENSCEINCHGGVFVTNEVLKLLLRHGFRLAEPGEFSKRAFLNHKMDLTKAESIMDIVNAENKLALRSSVNALNSSLGKLVSGFRNDILNLMAEIEVNIDYPEYEDATEVTQEYLLPNLNSLISKMNNILERSSVSKIIHQGINTAIVGRPNVGKSSLLNMLLDEDKAIVSNIAGTTRDIVEGNINLGEVSLHLLDTAGIRDSEDVIESIGIKKSRDLINTADLVFLVLDISEPLTTLDNELLELVKDKPHVIVANKTDLANEWQIEDDTVYISALNKEGILELKEAVLKVTNLNNFDVYNPILNNSRQISLMERAMSSLESARVTSSLNPDIALVASDLKDAFDYLGEITGETYSDELVTKLFTNFCLGK